MARGLPLLATLRLALFPPIVTCVFPVMPTANIDGGFRPIRIQQREEKRKVTPTFIKFPGCHIGNCCKLEKSTKDEGKARADPDINGLGVGYRR